MKKAFVIIAFSVLVLAASLVMIVASTLYTSAGRGFLASVAEGQIANALGGEATIGRLTGPLPGVLVIEDVVLSDSEGPWLIIDRIEARWRPTALVSKKVLVDLAAIDGGRLLRPPPSRPADAHPSDDGPVELPTLPDDLPNIEIGALQVSEFTVAPAVAGRAYSLSAEGAARISNGAVDIGATIIEAGGSDIVTATIGYDRQSGRVALDIEADSEADGAISQLLNANGPTSVRINGDAPASSFNAGIDVEVGALAAIDVELELDLLDFSTLRIVGDARPGDDLAAIRDAVGPRISMVATAETVERGRVQGLRLSIDEIRADIATANGEIEIWPGRGGDLDAARATFTVTPGPLAPALVRERLGETIEARAEIAAAGRRGLPYSIAFDVAASALSLKVADGRTDLASEIEGLVSLDAPELATLLGPAQSPVGPASITFRLDADAGGVIEVADLAASFAGEPVGAGRAAFSQASEEIDAAVTLSLRPSLIAVFAQDIAPSGVISGDASIRGALSDLAVDASLATPRIAINDDAIPAAATTIALRGLPSRPTGRVDARAAAGDGRLTAEVETMDDGAVAAPVISLLGQNFRLSGNAVASRTLDEFRAAFTYSGNEGATPFPGLSVVGDIALEASYSTANDNVAALVSAERLAIAGAGIEGLRFEIGGPLDAAPLTLAAQSIASGGPSVNVLSLEGVLSLSNATSLRLDSFSATVDREPYKLVQPALFTFDDGVSIAGLKLNLGVSGDIAIDARIASTRWRGEIMTKGFAPPGSPAAIDLRFSADTDEPQAGMGSLVARPIFADQTASPVAVDLLWDGASLNIVDAAVDGGVEGLKLDVALPLRLVRGESLSIDTSGALAGTVEYEGRAETIAQLGPPAAQPLEGDAALALTLAGSLAEPQIDGDLSLANGAYTETASGLSLVNIGARAKAAARREGTHVTFEGEASGAAQDQPTMFLTGDLDLGDASSLRSELRLEGAEVSAQMVESLKATGKIELAGALDDLAAVGAIKIDALNVALAPPPAGGFTPVEIIDAAPGESGVAGDLGAGTGNSAGNGTARGNVAGAGEAAAGSPIRLDLKITAPQELFVRGLGLESEWQADLNVAGTSAEPSVLGRIDLRRGALDFAGRRFAIADGEIIFDRLQANNPRLRIVAEYETPNDVVAALNVGGRATAPEITLSSSPSLPREDIMALILFGKPARDLTAVESLQIAQTLAQLSGAGPFGGGGGGVTGKARAALGLDMLNLDLDNASGSQSLTVGKYVADGLFVSATQSARGDEGAVRVEYELTNSITVETELKQDGDQTVSANWKVDF
ncbi:MAG: hypothetical protein GC152_11645 [Alphaproteobacteria bacterium]|nr:hypothetical protein [Alphaproteobacteria bacterium]